MIVGVAALAGVPEEKIDKYMVTKLDSAQLVEMLAALLDGVPEKTLDTFSLGNTSAEDMRTYRLNSRGDRLMDTVAEQVVQLRELVEKLSGPDKVTKLMREMKTDITSVKGCVENIEEKIGKGEMAVKKPDKENKEQAPVSKEPAKPKLETEVATNTQAAQNSRLTGLMK